MGHSSSNMSEEDILEVMRNDPDVRQKIAEQWQWTRNSCVSTLALWQSEKYRGTRPAEEERLRRKIIEYDAKLAQVEAMK